jgi:probable rRNA maturation factor
MNVVLANRQRTRKINRCLLKQITATLLADLKVEAAELGVHLVAAPEMIRLNEKFLLHAGPTDVIAFDYSEPGRPTPTPRPQTPDPGRQLHGEIFICVDEAVLQARKFRASWQSEITRYLVHGVLHLLGHDDAHPAERRKMKRAEDRRLRELSRRFSLAHLARPAKLSPCKNH